MRKLSRKSRTPFHDQRAASKGRVVLDVPRADTVEQRQVGTDDKI